MREIPTISLWQPWASLVILGEKRIETRHWKAPSRVIGCRIGIHAAKKTDLLLAGDPPFAQALRRHGLTSGLPGGCLLGTVVLYRCELMTAEALFAWNQTIPEEIPFGYYEVGRYAWHLCEPQRLAKPVPWKGRQGWFNVPAEVFA